MEFLRLLFSINDQESQNNVWLFYREEALDQKESLSVS